MMRLTNHVATPLPVRIAGTGIYLPEKRVSSAELEERLGLAPGWIERRTGVRERRHNGGETAAYQAACAARQALETAGVEAGELDAIVGASSGPQQLIPCTAAFVQRELGAPEGGSACFDINATCLSFLTALHTLAPLVAAGVYENVLIFSTEIASRSLNPCQPESFVLFGDGAAAAVLKRTPEGEASALHTARFATHHSGAEYTQYRGAGSLHPPNDPATLPFMNVFDMDGPAVFRQASRLAPPFLDEVFAKLDWRRDEVARVIPHQASRRGLDLFTARLGFTDEQVFRNIAERGNCIAASMPMALHEAIQAGKVQRGDRILMAGTGAGLTLGAVALTY
jgi:3-oxoacyl-[acyl-carrier-protein] synthase-3